MKSIHRNIQVSFSLLILIPLFGFLTMLEGGNDKTVPDCLIIPDGDINLDGRLCDTADAMLMIEYFMHGDTVLTIDKPEQIEKSDANWDGRYLNLSDLVYMTRVITGDAMPQHLLPTNLDTVTLNITNDTLSVSSKIDLGAAFFAFNSDIDFDLLDSAFQIQCDYVSGKTRILFYSLHGARFIPGTTAILKSFDLQALDSCEFSGYYGNRVVTLMPDRK